MPVGAEDFSKGLNAYSGGDYVEALKWFRRAAEQGHAGAQSNLGFMYDTGDGVPQDYAEAAKWYHHAADNGDAEAQFAIGSMYRNGQGVPQDYVEAVKWLRRAAEQGHVDAEFNLGLMYRNGQGVPQDHAEAVKWFQSAAEQGHAGAQNNLGLMYRKGEGVPQDDAVRRRPLSPAFRMAILAGAMESVRLHLRSGININATDEKGRSPLILVVSRGRLDLCQLLLAEGADPSIWDNEGNDALAVARLRGQAEIAELLGSAGLSEDQHGSVRDKQMVAIIGETDRAGLPVVPRRHKGSEQTLYTWKKRFGAFQAYDVRRLKQPEQENARLKELVDLAGLFVLRRPAA